jgi:hypothetical protein
MLHRSRYMNALRSILKVVLADGAGLAVMELVRRVNALLPEERRLRRTDEVGCGTSATGLALPRLGRSDNPTSYDSLHHSASYAEHIGFGVATAAMTRVLCATRDQT